MCRSATQPPAEFVPATFRIRRSTVNAGQGVLRVDLLLSRPRMASLARPGVVAEATHFFVDRAVSRLTDTPLWRFEAMSLARYGDLRVGRRLRSNRGGARYSGRHPG
jgi:hypothetical protein